MVYFRRACFPGHDPLCCAIERNGIYDKKTEGAGGDPQTERRIS